MFSKSTIDFIGYEIICDKEILLFYPS